MSAVQLMHHAQKQWVGAQKWVGGGMHNQESTFGRLSAVRMQVRLRARMVVAYAASWPGSSRLARNRRAQRRDRDGANAPPFEVRRAAAEAAQDGLHGRAGPAAAAPATSCGNSTKTRAAACSGSGRRSPCFEGTRATPCSTCSVILWRLPRVGGGCASCRTGRWP